jgi:alkylated DNA repair dioxygenase AlkB
MEIFKWFLFAFNEKMIFDGGFSWISVKMAYKMPDEHGFIEELKGFRFLPEFISVEEEAVLLKEIAAMETDRWCNDLKRRTAHFGYKYNYESRNAAVKLGDLPDWQADVLTRLESVCKRRFNQLILNEYLPGQGISKHVDSPKSFCDTITTLSLGSGATMVFRRGNEAVPVYLPRRSLVLLQDDARYAWTHEIPARKSDVLDGKRVPRETRVSLTYRKVMV